MDERWRNLSLIGVAIVVIIVAYTFLPALLAPQPVSFDDGLLELNSIWAAEGVSFFMSDSELEQVSKQDLFFLKAETFEFGERAFAQANSDESIALFSLANVYGVRLNVFITLKELAEAEAVYSFTGNESDEVVCEKVSILDGVQESLVVLQQDLVAQNAELELFELENPAEFEKAGFVLSLAKQAEVEETIQSNALLIAEIKRGCA
ncbi:MAG: hypothetical protein QGI60_05950 [archaeon]|nr:hypothetical protein [archaeon]